MRVLDIFCGAGGLAHGFRKVGFEITGVDISEDAGKTFEINDIGSFIKADLSNDIIGGEYDIIIGGPPCKPWSTVNMTRRGKSHRDYHLLSSFFKHIEHHLPVFFMMENVRPLANDENFKKHTERMKRYGYSIITEGVKYSDFGAPTRRQRLIVFGIKDGNAEIFFQKLSKYMHSALTVRDVIWDLRERGRGESPDHVWPELRTINRYRKYYKSGKFGWYILKWDAPAPSFGNIMKTYTLHPDSFNGKPARVISVREALLIMGFNEKFHFPEGTGIGLRYQMVVDSVSPVFSYVAAKVIKEIISGRSGTN